MKPKYLIVGMIVGLVLCLIGLPLAFAFGKTGKSTQILSKDYSLLSKQQIITRLNSDFPLPDNLVLRADNREFNLNLVSISAHVDTDRLTSNLLYRRLNQGISRYFQAFFQPKNFNLEITYKSDNLDQYLATLASQIDQPFVPTELNLDPKTKAIIVKTGQIGKKVDINALKESILNSLKFYELKTPLGIPLVPVGSLATPESIAQVKLTAATLVDKSLSLSVSDQIVDVDSATLISWLGFNDTPCRQDRVDEYTNNLKKNLKKDPVDAVFKFENNKVLDFQPAANGYSITDTNLSSNICSSLLKLTTSSDKNSKIDVAINTVEPKLKTGDANNFGIKDLLGQGKSTFRSSTDLRNYNVAKGASIVNRILVAPGDTFSFLKNLGDVSLVSGYKQGYVIKEGKTVLDVGGGICQVSTTLFRAILNAGLDITSRQNHAYRVHYYEEDMPPGYDATVFIPSPDLKFVNDTGHYLLIQNTYNATEKSLVYQIYGTSDGRKVDISNYHQWDAQPAPPAIYNDDPTLPAGKTVQDEHAIPGLKTAFDWKVNRDGQIIHQKTFTSSYSPWAAVYRRGPAVQ